MKLKRWAVIVTGFYAVFILSVGSSLFIALSNPVELDETEGYSIEYMKDNYHLIMQYEKDFDAQFVFDYPSELQEPDKARFRFFDRKGMPVENSKIDLLITRPASNRDDLRAEGVYEGNGIYVFPTEVERVGDWLLFAYIYIGDRIITKRYELSDNI